MFTSKINNKYELMHYELGRMHSLIMNTSDKKIKQDAVLRLFKLQDLILKDDEVTKLNTTT